MISPVEALGWWERNEARTGASSSAGGAVWRRQGSTRSTVAMASRSLLDPDQADDVPVAQAGPPAQVLQLDDEPHAHHLATQALHEPDRSRGGAARGQHVVHHEHPLTGKHTVAVDLQAIGAVLELVLLAGHGPGELAGLAHGHEGGAAAVGDGGGHDEAARLDADHTIDGDAGEVVRDGVHDEAERIRMAEHRRDVAEGDARLGVVRDGPDVRCQPAGIHGHRFRLPLRSWLAPDALMARSAHPWPQLACGSSLALPSPPRDSRSRQPAAAL